MLDHKYTNPDYCFGCGHKFGEHTNIGGLTHHKTNKGVWITGYKCTHCTIGMPHHPDQVKRWETKQQIEAAAETNARPMAKPMPRMRQLDARGNPITKHPDFPWLALYVEHVEELKELFGNFKSFRQWCSSHSYQIRDIEQAIEHRREQLS